MPHSLKPRDGKLRPFISFEVQLSSFNGLDGAG